MLARSGEEVAWHRYCAVLIVTAILHVFTLSNIHAEWIFNGTPVCEALGNQTNPQLGADGNGNVIIAWDDYRNGNLDVYAQKIDKDGSILWAVNGIGICIFESTQAANKIIVDENGKAIIAWQDYRDGILAIYVQKIDENGNQMWQPSGVSVTDPFIYASTPVIASDGHGGVIIAWNDERGDYSANIYAQRIDSLGNPVWQTDVEDYVTVCSAPGDQWDCRIISDDRGGAIISWADERFQSDIYQLYVQRLNENGTTLWADDGIRVEVGETIKFAHQMTSDGSSGAFISWVDYGASTPGICVQRIDSLGGYPLGVGCKGLDPTQLMFYQRIEYDGENGAIVTWSDYDELSERENIYAQKVDKDSGIQWGYEPVTVCDRVGTQRNPVVTATGGVAMIAWPDWCGVCVQGLDGSGNELWTHNGVVVTDLGSQLEIESDNLGGAYLVWRANRDGDLDILAMRIHEGLAPVSTLLQSYDVYCSESGVVIEWILNEVIENMRFRIIRHDIDKGSHIELDDLKIVCNDPRCSFVDDEAELDTEYRYAVIAVHETGEKVLFVTESISIPTIRAALHQNIPNPFNPTTTIKFDLPRPMHVKLTAYGIKGELVATLVNQCMAKGRREVTWNAMDYRGRPVAGGIYFYRLVAGDFVQTRKMVLLR